MRGTPVDQQGGEEPIDIPGRARRGRLRRPPITLHRCTHVLEGELNRACEELEAFLMEREEEERRAPADAAPAR